MGWGGVGVGCHGNQSHHISISSCPVQKKKSKCSSAKLQLPSYLKSAKLQLTNSTTSSTIKGVGPKTQKSVISYSYMCKVAHLR